MLKNNYVLSLMLLVSIPAVAMENPAAGNRTYQQVLTAARTGNLAELLTIQRANPNLNFGQISDRGMPLLLIAVIQGNIPVVNHLLRVVRVNPAVTFNGQNALHLAANRGNFEMVKYLVEMAHFDINAIDKSNKTALELAKQTNHAEIISYLTSRTKKAARPLPPVPTISPKMPQSQNKPAALVAPAQTLPVTPVVTPPAAPVVKQAPQPITKSCIICAEDRNPDQFITLGCGHEYCKECLAVMLASALREKSTKTLKCPTPGCGHSLEDEAQKITTDRAQIAQLSEIQLQEWLTKQHNTKNCPTPNCGFSFINERGADQFTMQCPDCKNEYCGKCLHTHNPLITCQNAEQERNLANDTNAQARANQQWVEANTKPCPRCGTRTEKNGGCMHMNCRNCNYHYCWNCLGEWINHGDYYNCQNRTQNPLNPQVHQAAPQQEQITMQNAHLFFARDPRGFVNSANSRQHLPNVDMNFAERFMRLSCEDQGAWAVRISQLLENDHYEYYAQMPQYWIEELERLEPFALRAQIHQPTQEGTFVAQITANRPLMSQLQDQIQEWIVNQNPQDLIMFKGWINSVLYCETSLSQERLQEVLDQASRHFRAHAPTEQTPELAAADVQNTRTVLEVDSVNRLIRVAEDISPDTFTQLLNYLSELRRGGYDSRWNVNRDEIIIWDHIDANRTNLPVAELQDIVNRGHNFFNEIVNRAAQRARGRVLQVQNGAIRALAHTPRNLFDQYADYITNMVRRIYGEAYVVTPYPNIGLGEIHITIWHHREGFHTYVNEATLQTIVDNTHHHFANLNQ